MQTEIIVVGGGGSGLSAAISAAEAGARVVLLEKNSQLGGTTARSIGSVSSTGTAHQLRMGIIDKPEWHFEDMALFQQEQGLSRPDNEVLRRILVDNMPETFRWLERTGIEFLGPLEEKPHRVPRMHNVMPNSRAYIYHLERRARRCGVNILTDARARRFLLEGSEVVGVEYERSGKIERVHASRGVILASGHYAAHPEFLRQFVNDAVSRLEPVDPTATGDGHRMALDLGAQILNADLWSGGMRFVRPVNPPLVSRVPPYKWLMRVGNLAMRWAPGSIVRKLLMSTLTTVLVPTPKLYKAGAIFVNRNGQRFADEVGGLPYNLAEQPGAEAFIIFDAGLANKFSGWPHYISTAPGVAYAYLKDYQRTRPDLFHKADTLETLAAELGMPAANLVAAVNAYNDSNTPGAAGGSGGVANALPPRGERAALTQGPWYALGPARNFIHYTDGGLAIDAEFRLLGRGGRPIERLYAVGNVGQGGGLLKGHGHHLAWAFTSGRLAGQRVAACAPRNLSKAQINQETA